MKEIQINNDWCIHNINCEMIQLVKDIEVKFNIVLTIAGNVKDDYYYLKEVNNIKNWGRTSYYTNINTRKIITIEYLRNLIFNTQTYYEIY